MKASRAFFSEVEKKFGTMAFTLRSFEDEKRARMGVVECVTHKLVEPFNVLYEREGEFVAQSKFTVLLMPSKSHRITGLPVDLSLYESEYKITDPSIISILSTGSKTNKKKKGKPGNEDPKAGGDSQNQESVPRKEDDKVAPK